jgi:hypothetical protein
MTDRICNSEPQFIINARSDENWTRRIAAQSPLRYSGNPDASNVDDNNNHNVPKKISSVQI